MSIKYYDAPEVKRLVHTIVVGLRFNHIDPTYVYCVRSRGSKSKHTIARVHSLGKPWQLALNTHPRYLIEVIAERYDKLSQADQEKILIHELLHIPATRQPRSRRLRSTSSLSSNLDACMPQLPS